MLASRADRPSLKAASSLVLKVELRSDITDSDSSSAASSHPNSVEVKGRQLDPTGLSLHGSDPESLLGFSPSVGRALTGSRDIR